MTAITVKAPERAGRELARMVHIFCLCTPDVALCGKPVTELAPDMPVECVVCAELLPKPCPRCAI